MQLSHGFSLYDVVSLTCFSALMGFMAGNSVIGMHSLLYNIIIIIN